jgi:hypothetical protein
MIMLRQQLQIIFSYLSLIIAAIIDECQEINSGFWRKHLDEFIMIIFHDISYYENELIMGK